MLVFQGVIYQDHPGWVSNGDPCHVRPMDYTAPNRETPNPDTGGVRPNLRCPTRLFPPRGRSRERRHTSRDHLLRSTGDLSNFADTATGHRMKETPTVAFGSDAANDSSIPSPPVARWVAPCPQQGRQGRGSRTLCLIERVPRQLAKHRM